MQTGMGGVVIETSDEINNLQHQLDNGKILAQEIWTSGVSKMKADINMQEFHGMVKYSGIATGTISWKSGSLVFHQGDTGSKLEVMYDCNSNRPVLTLLLDKKSVEKAICKESFHLDVKTPKDGVLTVNFRPANGRQCVREIETIMNRVKSVATTPTMKAEVGIKTSTPLSSRKTLFSSYTRPESVHNGMDASPQSFTSVKENRKLDRDVILSEDFSDEDNSKENKSMTPNKVNSEKFLQRGSEKSRQCLGSLGISFYGSKPASTSSPLSTKTTPSKGWLNSKRQPGMMPDPIPIKRARLSDSISYSMKAKSTPVVDQKRPQTLQGFSNLGNTCYMNAILQALFALDVFSSDLQLTYRKHSKSIQPQSLYYAFWKLLSSRKQAIPDSVRRDHLKRVKIAISASAKRFSGYGQHDAHEFLGQVLDQLKEEVVKVTAPSPRHSPTPVSMATDTSDSVSTDINPTICSFEFEVLHTITCVQCQEEVSKSEQFLDVSLDLPKRRDLMTPRSLQDALNLFFRNEQIDYTCEKCQGSKSEVSHKFVRLPRVLILHLKRYNFDMTAARHTKMGRNVAIPLFLTLQSYCDQQTHPPFPSSVAKATSSFRFSKKGLNTSSDSITEKDKTLDEDKEIRLLDVDEDDDPEFAKAIELSLQEQREREKVSQDFGDGSDTHLQQVLELSRCEDARQDLTFKSSDLESLSEDEQLRLAIEKSLVESNPCYRDIETSSDLPDLPEDARSAAGENGIHTHITRQNIDCSDRDIDSKARTSIKSDKEFKMTTDRHTVEDSEHSGGGSAIHSVNSQCSNEGLTKLEEKSDPEKSLGKNSKNWRTRLSALGSAIAISSDDDENSPADEVDGGPDLTSHGVHIAITIHDDCHTSVQSSSKSRIAGTEPGTLYAGDTSVSGATEKGSNSSHNKENQGTSGFFLEDGEEDDSWLLTAEDKENTVPTGKPGQDVGDTPSKLCLEEKENKVPLQEKPVLTDPQSVVMDTSPADEVDECEDLDLPQVSNERGELPFSYRLVSVVSHIGMSSSTGHYVSDAYDLKKRSWSSFDDSHVSKTSEQEVRNRREQTGYIFFYLHKDIFDDVCDQHALETTSLSYTNRRTTM